MRTILLASGVVILSSVAADVSAQETRKEVVLQQRANKAKALGSYERGRIEAFLLRLESDYLVQRIFNPPRGIFLRYGGFPEGAGLAIGPAYRHSNRWLTLTTSAAASVQRYWDVETRLTFPRLAKGRLFAEVGGRVRDLPREDFYGLGPDSARATRTSYSLRESSIEATGGVSPLSWLSVAGSAGYLRPRLGSGRDPRMPSTEEVFSDTDAPALHGAPDYARVGARVSVDYTDKPLGPRSGGRYLISYSRYEDQDFACCSFGRWDVDIRQYIPLVARSRSLALRAYFASVKAGAGQNVPFFLQPTLGGGYSLRGLRSYRLRDRNALLLQAEYRWDVNPFLSGVLFYDTGQVALRLADFKLDELQHDYGFGVRLGWLQDVAIRAEVAFGGKEGTRLVLKFNDAF
jgi:hypothetical protein